MSIKIIQQFTEDALANQFELTLPPFPGVRDLAQTNLRLLTIDIPEYSIGLYEITKNGTKFQRRSGMSEVPTEFSFSFRVDRNYDIYLGFLTWLRLCRDSVTGVMAPESVIRFPISVAPVDTGGNQLSNGWIFQGCFPSNMSGLTFDEDSGDPLTVDITMQMLGYDPVIL